MDPEGTSKAQPQPASQPCTSGTFVSLRIAVARTQNAAHAVGLPVCWHCPPAAMWASARRRTRTGSLADSAALPRCAKFTWQQQQQRLQQTHVCSIQVAWHVSHRCGHCAACANNTAQLAAPMPLLSRCYHAPVQALSCALCGPVLCCPVPQLPARISRLPCSYAKVLSCPVLSSPVICTRVPHCPPLSTQHPPAAGLRPLPCPTAGYRGTAQTGPARPQQPCHAARWPSGNSAQTAGGRKRGYWDGVSVWVWFWVWTAVRRV